MRSLHGMKQILGALLLACSVYTPLSHSALIELQPDTTFASNGGSFTLDLVVSGLGDFSPDSLGAFDISVGFDATALSFTSYVLGDFLGDIDLFEAIDGSAGDIGGAVNVAEVSLLSAAALDALQPDSFTLATLSFSVVDLSVGEDTELLVLSGAELVDATGSLLSVTTSGPATVVGSGSVPIPGTMYLLLASFGGLVVTKSRTQSLSKR
jgi:hypothetical protein